MAPINRLDVWRAGEAALQRCGEDVETRRVWSEVATLLHNRPPIPTEAFLRQTAAALDGLGSDTARRYAQVCDALADRFADGTLSEAALLDLTKRLDTEQIPPALRRVGNLLRSWGALQATDAKQRGLLSLGLDLLAAPPEKRYALTARLLVSRSPLAEGGAMERSAICLTEALLREIARQRRDSAA